MTDLLPALTPQIHTVAEELAHDHSEVHVPAFAKGISHTSANDPSLDTLFKEGLPLQTEDAASQPNRSDSQAKSPAGIDLFESTGLPKQGDLPTVATSTESSQLPEEEIPVVASELQHNDEDLTHPPLTPSSLSVNKIPSPPVGITIGIPKPPVEEKDLATSPPILTADSIRSKDQGENPGSKAQGLNKERYEDLTPTETPLSPSVASKNDEADEEATVKDSTDQVAASEAPDSTIHPTLYDAEFVFISANLHGSREYGVMFFRAPES